MSTAERAAAQTAVIGQVPAKVSLDGLEAAWDERWKSAGTYAFDRTQPREAIYSIDTPPPTASGSLHVGHVFSYTHTDVLARYKRMRGYEVFYPMGWDDNGLPTERRVQNYYGVRVDLNLPYDPDFVPPHQGTDGKSIKAADQVPISRANFIELCEKLTVEDERQFEALWRQLGLSVDWAQTYQTIDSASRATAQRAFLRNLARGEAYQAEAPGLWDVTFQTAVAQAELEAREYPGHYHKIAFHRLDDAGQPLGGGLGEPIYIETTRPELIPAVVALIAHPDDERYQHLFGTTVRAPLFDIDVPVLAHPAAEPDKGAGIAMCCTFGDLTDVQWWRELQLPTHSILQRDGRLLTEVPAWITAPKAVEFYRDQLAGRTTFSARKAIVDALRESGELDGEPTPTLRNTNFFEKGDKPLEIVTSRQWYIRNGGRDEELRQELLARGRELHWHPDHMKVRYADWVNGLNGDWLVSRQRFFGVAIPLWYPVLADGTVDYAHPITPSEASLPVDPMSQAPAGFTEDQRGKPGGFVGESDVLDTWATSSLTPLIVTGWERDPDLFQRTFPMDLRPQAHDIIRTWLFSTVVRSHLELNELPWSDVAISGWILDPDRKKMSKSKGNVVTPANLLTQHSADAVRYWAASARLGADTAFDEGMMKIGRRLAIKVLNAAKFVLSIAGEEGTQLSLDPAAVTEPLDKAMLAALAAVVDQATAAFENYDHTRALEVTESFFWTFCDDYVELVKERAYGSYDEAGELDPRPGRERKRAKSAQTALAIALDTLLRLLAPFLPFATEEVWSWWHDPAADGSGSIHRAPWPTSEPLRAAAGDVDPRILTDAGNVLAALRKIKTEAKVSQRTPILSVTMTAPKEMVERLHWGATEEAVGQPGVDNISDAAIRDVCAAGRAQKYWMEHATGDVDLDVQGGVVVTASELGEPPAKNK